MSRIAVAGGTGGVGKTFTDALSKTKHQVFVLSRSVSSKSDRLKVEKRPLEFSNVSNVQVDYGNIEATTALLEQYQIDTVISAIMMIDEDASTSQLNLIKAAEQSSVTKRFIPSEFGVLATEETAQHDSFARFWVDNAKALSKTSLQYTRISVGSLMDWWGMPRLKSTLNRFYWAIDIENKVAALPTGTEDMKMSMTYTYDLAAFVIKMLDETNWPEQCAVVGQDVTLRQMLHWAEQATGSKFKVSYESMEDLEKGKVTALNDEMRSNPLFLEVAAGYGIMLNKGLILLPDDEGFRLNHRFPDVPVLTFEEMIRQNWT